MCGPNRRPPATLRPSLSCLSAARNCCPGDTAHRERPAACVRPELAQRDRRSLCRQDDNDNERGTDMDDSSRQLLLATFAYLVFMGGLISTLGVAFGT